MAYLEGRIELFMGGAEPSLWAELSLDYPHFPQPVENPPIEGCHMSAEKRRIRRLLPGLAGTCEHGKHCGDAHQRKQTSREARQG
jgi:hypothetical protein